MIPIMPHIIFMFLLTLNSDLVENTSYPMLYHHFLAFVSIELRTSEPVFLTEAVFQFQSFGFFTSQLKTDEYLKFLRKVNFEIAIVSRVSKVNHVR